MTSRKYLKSEGRQFESGREQEHEMINLTPRYGSINFLYEFMKLSFVLRTIVYIYLCLNVIQHLISQNTKISVKVQDSINVMTKSKRLCCLILGIMEWGGIFGHCHQHGP